MQIAPIAENQVLRKILLPRCMEATGIVSRLVDSWCIDPLGKFANRVTNAALVSLLPRILSAIAWVGS